MEFYRIFFSSIIGLATLLLLACGSHVPRWIPSGTLAYQDGYYDGCYSGSFVRWGMPPGIERKEKREYESNSEYRKGWDEARATCEKNVVISEPFHSDGAERGGM